MPLTKGSYDDVPTVLEGMTSPGAVTTDTPKLKRKHLQYHEDDFIVDPDIPLFDEHNGAEEGLDIDFTPEVLQQICDNTNHRILDTNDLIPVYVGHINDKLPEGEQGELMGFVTNLHVGQIGELDPRACIRGDIKWLKDKYEDSKEYTRRSVEIWFDDMVLDNLAILKRRPERNLGILFQKNNSTHKYKRICLQQEKDIMAEVHDLPDGDDELIKKVMDHVMACPHMKFVHDLMNKEKESALDKIEEDDDAEMPADMAAGDAEKEIEDEEEMPEKEKLKAQRDQGRRQYAKLLQSNKELETRLAAMEKAARVAERKADLLELEALGSVFDIGEELEYVADLDKARYQKHLNKIKKNYSRAPIGVKIEQAKVVSETTTQDDVYKALKTNNLKTY